MIKTFSGNVLISYKVLRLTTCSVNLNKMLLPFLLNTCVELLTILKKPQGQITILNRS